MTLALNDTAPDFEAQTTEGKIRFHDWIGNSWAVLFSHPKDFTPVCTTELGYMAKIKPEFDKRGVKIIGLSVDPIDRHAGWAADIKETQGYAPNYPMIGDTDFNVSKLYGMLPADRVGRSRQAHGGRQPDRPQRVRHRAGQEDEAHSRLSDDHGPQLRRGAARDRLAPADRQAQGGDAGELERRRGRHHRRARCPTRTPRSSIRRDGRRRSPISASCRSRADAGGLSIRGRLQGRSDRVRNGDPARSC